MHSSEKFVLARFPWISANSNKNSRHYNFRTFANISGNFQRCWISRKFTTPSPEWCNNSESNRIESKFCQIESNRICFQPNRSALLFHLPEGMLHSFQRWLPWKKSRLWVGIGGSEKNRLWCVPNGMPGKQRYSKCSKWPPSVWIHASSLFRHWSTASSTTLYWKLKSGPCGNKMLPQLVRFADWYSIRVKKMKTMKNLYILQGDEVTFFSCDGYGSNSLFSSEIT